MKVLADAIRVTPVQVPGAVRYRVYVATWQLWRPLVRPRSRRARLRGVHTPFQKLVAVTVQEADAAGT